MTAHSIGILLLALSPLGCGKGDDGDSGSEVPPPEVAGRYNVQVRWASGCEGDSSWVEDWATGPLLIEGSEGSLTFDFYDDMSFLGQVDGSGSTTFGGTVEWDEAVLDVTLTGSFYKQEEQWILKGEFSIVVDDDVYTSNNCTVESGIEAYELVGTD